MDKSLVLKYLGYENQVIDEDLDEKIDRHMQTMSQVSGHTIYQIFDIKKDDLIYVRGTKLELRGRSIKHILSQANQIVLFAATLGPEVDQVILKAGYLSKVDQMILDACASVRIEELLDLMAEGINKFQTPRFSPGYGDLDISIQKALVQVIDGRRIGLTVTDSSLLIPKKSVTGIIGLSDQIMDITYRFCDDCLKRTSCDFKICSRE
ncbi:hypothetical protein EZV73_06470 [Acidaminobacter sp. JC074]|uniref:vitamin B12 dependent-methionine synthase activation domain-containing protein n=1 Tax=Acidaminobacter sp. JC074 TaxID=2530199 RepID=UPI001F0D10CD|nr:vitamin B12 dependent-methionine synthase activation domain-containing protein [Acidaminobacter sp. JC074]MCH4887206.1 hypothetical protein [Acidaminobacter sp. JC074]